MAQSSDASDVGGAAVPDLFPIVGVGASAGGLTPTVELIRALGPRPEIAVVVVHHLDPAHESDLIEILSRATSLAVVPATHGVPVERNHFYELPPNTGLLIGPGPSTAT